MRLFNRDTRQQDSEEGSAVADVLRLAAGRIDEIVAASDRAAADIRSAASERLNTSTGAASQITREQIVAELAESLVKRADELRADAAQLADVLSRASGRLADSAPTPPSESATQVEPDGPPVTPATISGGPDLSKRVSDRFASAGTSLRQVPGGRVPFKRKSSAIVTPQLEAGRPSNDGLRLLATQMAVAGSTRGEIEERLQSEFGVEDPSAIFVGLSIPDSR